MTAPDLGVEHAQFEPVEEDPGAARVVDQDVAVAEQVRQLLDRRVEVAVPAVAIDAVVRGAEVIDRLGGPVVIGYGRPSRRAIGTRSGGATRRGWVW